MVLKVILINTNSNVNCKSILFTNDDELYKKCGFKTSDSFALQNIWKLKTSDGVFKIEIFAKTIGKHNNVNKYDLPPPVDKTLFYGTIMIRCLKENSQSNEFSMIDLDIDMWNVFYEKLFGGFENLKDTCYEDENESDELEHIHHSKKTKNGGYLKDGFVVDDDISDENEDISYCSDSINESTDDTSDSENIIDDELCEEEYDYDTDKNDD